MGAFGSGKTTLLNCIATIDKVTTGHIIINNNDITKLKGNELNKFRRKELGFIFQDFNLLDTLTSYENIALALTIQKVNHNDIEKRVKDIAKKLDISNIINKYPYQLSKEQLSPSIIMTIIIMCIIYICYLLATYVGSKNIIKDYELKH